MCTLAIVHYGHDSMHYFIWLIVTQIPYMLCFMYLEQARLSHKQHKNVFKI